MDRFSFGHGNQWKYRYKTEFNSSSLVNSYGHGQGPVESQCFGAHFEIPAENKHSVSTVYTGASWLGPCQFVNHLSCSTALPAGEEIVNIEGLED